MKFLHFMFIVVAFSFFPTKETLARDAEFSVMGFGVTKIHVQVLRTKEERNKGLSGRMFLPEGEGALFVYESPKRSGIWMPNMHFAIDVVWLNEEFVVVDIKENATPESYPKVFKSRLPARYVLEVPSGYTAKKGIGIGSKALFQE